MAQGTRLELPLGYATSNVVSLGGGSALAKISTSYLGAAVCLSPKYVSGIVGIGLMRAWVRSAAACVAACFEEILGKVSVSGKILYCWRLSI